MFKKLKSLFSKKEKEEEEDVLCGITLYKEKGGEIYVDVRMADESEETLEALSSILCMYSPSGFFQVSSVIKAQLENREELYGRIIEKVTGMVTFNQDDIDEEYTEKPCINPSDMI